jgi:hypothetical protein
MSLEHNRSNCDIICVRNVGQHTASDVHEYCCNSGRYIDRHFNVINDFTNDKTIDVKVAEHNRNNCDIVQFFNVGQHTASGDINVCEVERDSRCRDSFH